MQLLCNYDHESPLAICLLFDLAFPFQLFLSEIDLASLLLFVHGQRASSNLFSASS